MKLIEDCHQWWRFASVRVAALAGLIISYLASDPGLLAYLVGLIPTPLRWLSGFIVFAIPTIARLMKQPALEPRPMAPMALVDAPARADRGRAKLIALVGGAAASMLVSSVATWEGKRNDPYRDIVGVQTVCYGDTKVPMRRYSDAECADMLQARLVDYAGPVLKRNPELAGHAPQLAAASSLAYNIGTASYAKSSAARLFSAGRWREACDAFLAWRMAGGKVVNGLVRRRQAERALCLKDLPPAAAR